MAKIVEVPGYGDVEFPDSMDDASITKVVANQYRENEFAKSLTKGQTVSALPDGKIPKDRTQMPPEALGRGQRDFAEDLGRSARRGIARPLLGALKTANDDFGAGLRGTEKNLEKWIGDQGVQNDWIRAAGGAIGSLPYLVAGVPALLGSVAGGALDTRADLKREGATELAASGVAALDAGSTLLAGKFLNSTKPFTSAAQNVGQEYVTGKAQKYVLDNSMTPELADRFDPTASQLTMAGIMGAGVPAVRRGLANADKVRYGDLPKGVRPSVIDSAKKQVEQAKNLEQGFTADGTGIVLKEPVLNKGQTAIANKLSLGDEVTNATNDIDAQRIQAPQFGSANPRFNQSLEDFGASQDARVQADSLIQTGRQRTSDARELERTLNTLSPEERQQWIKDGKLPDATAKTIEKIQSDAEQTAKQYQGDPTKPALLQDPTKPNAPPPPPKVAALFKGLNLQPDDDPLKPSALKDVDGMVEEPGPKKVIVFHAGSDFDNIDPKFFGRGEQGGIRPLGNGLYGYIARNAKEAANAVKHVRAYLKYSPLDKQALHAFELPLNQGDVLFRGNVWDEDLLTQESRDRMAKVKAANALPAGPERTAAFDELAKDRPSYREQRARDEKMPVQTETLSNLGLIEAGVTDYSRLKRLGKWNPDASDEDIVRSLYPDAATAPKPKPDAMVDDVSGQIKPDEAPKGWGKWRRSASMVDFYSWFKDSKVVDNSGKPLVVYHGTNKTDGGEAFRSFDTYGSNYGLMGMGSYFTTDADVASDYTRKGKGDSPTVYPVYLSIKNPIDMDGPADVEAWKRAFPDAEAYHDGGKTNESWFRAAEESLMDQQIPHYEGAETMQESLRGMGFDGITHMGGNRVGTKPHRVFIAFDPEQIKSATGNRGTYDPNNPDINANNAPKGWGKVETGAEDIEPALQKLVQQAIERVRASLTKDNVFAAIDAVRNATVNENYKAILDRVKGVLENMESQGIKINYKLDENNDVQVDGQGVRGYHKSTPGKQIEIGLNKALGGADNYEVFTHELVHAVGVPLAQRVAYAIATKDTAFLTKNPDLVAAHKDLQNLFRELKGKTPGDLVPKQALKNMQELLAYGMTNKATIDWLKTQTVQGTNGLMAFVKAVGKFLGFGKDDVNAHTQLWYIFDRMATAGQTSDFTFNGKGKSSDIKILDGVYAAADEKPDVESKKSGNVLLRIPGLENAAGNRIKDLPTLMKGVVDVKATEILDTFRPGMRNKAWMTKHPLLQVVNNEVAQAKARANTFLEKYVTGKEGFGLLGAKMSDSELAEVNTIYSMASKQKVRLDPSKIEGLNDAQKTYLNRIYKALDARWANANRLREEAGLPKIPYRQGYYPGILEADFASVGVDKDGMVVAIAGDNTKWAYKRAKNWLGQQEGVVEVVEIKNGKASNNFRQNDVLTGLLKIMEILPKDDPSVPKIKALKEQVELMTNDQLFGMHLHRLPKKGITGFVGDRPWLDASQNAREFHKGLINFFSKAAVADELHVPIRDMKQAFDTFGKDHPNAVAATKRWLGQVAGTHGVSELSEVGRGINAVVYGIGRMAGFGPSKVRGGLGLGADIATQHVLGWFNMQFLGSNFVQILQGGGPFAVWASDRLGMDPLTAGTAWTEGMAKASVLLGEYFAPGQKLKVPVDDFSRQAWDYAQRMGILKFSEIERLHAESQNKWKQRYDNVAEATMKMGEVGTRPLVFMAMANMLKHSKYGSEVSQDVLLEHAYNITQFAMADYSPEQRPLLYSELGIAGQMLGKFATYKHNFVGQEAFFAKESVKDPMPFLTMNGMLFALSGALGMPAMEEILAALEKITGENYKEKILKNMNLVGAYGVLSEALGINVSAKFSAGNMLPDDALNTLPSVSILTKAMQTVLDAGTKAVDGTFTSQDAKNVGRAVLPSSMQREFDRQFNRGPNNELIGKEGDTRDYLTDEEWDARKFFGWQGTTTQEAARNAVDRESFRTNTKNEERIRGSLDATARMMNQGELSQKAFEIQSKKYLEAGGDPEKFADEIRRRVSVLKQPLWFRRMRKNGDEVAPTPGNARILDNPYRQQ